MEHQDHPFRQDDYDNDLGASHHNWDQPQEHLTFPIGPGADQESPTAAARGSTSSLNPEAPEFQWQKYSNNEGSALDLSGSQSSWGNSERQGLDWTQYDEEMSGQPSMMYWGQSSPLVEGHNDEEQVISPIEDLENPFTLEEHARQQLSHNAQLGQVFTEHQEQEASDEVPNRSVEQLDLNNEVMEPQQFVQDNVEDPQSVADESLSNIAFEAQVQILSPSIENALLEPTAAGTIAREADPPTEDVGPVDHTADVFAASDDSSQPAELPQTNPFLSESSSQQSAVYEVSALAQEAADYLEPAFSNPAETFETRDTPAVAEDQTRDSVAAVYPPLELDTPADSVFQGTTEELLTTETINSEEPARELQDSSKHEVQVQEVLGFSEADDRVINEDQLLSPQDEVAGQPEQMEEPAHENNPAVASLEEHDEHPTDFPITPEEPVKDELAGMTASEDLLQEAVFTQDNRILADETAAPVETHIPDAAADFTEEVMLQASSHELATSPANVEIASTPGELATSSFEPDYTDEVKEETATESLSEDLCQPVVDGAPIHEDYEAAAVGGYNDAASVEDDILVADKEDVSVAEVETVDATEDALQADSQLSPVAPESYVTEVNGNTIETVEAAQVEAASAIWDSHRGADNDVNNFSVLDETTAPVEESQANTAPASLACNVTKCTVEQLISPLNRLNLEETLTPAVATNAQEPVESSEIQVNNLDQAADSLEPVEKASTPDVMDEQVQSPEEVSIPSAAEEQGPSSEDAPASFPEDQASEERNEVSPDAVSDEKAEAEVLEKQQEAPKDAQPSESVTAAVAGGVAAAVAGGVAAAATAVAGAAKSLTKKPAGKKPLTTATSPTKPKPSPAVKEPAKKAEVKPARPTRLSPLRKAAPAAAPRSASKPAQPAAATAAAAPRKPVSATTRPAAPLVKKTTAPDSTTSALKTSPAKPAASTLAAKKPTTAPAAVATSARPAATRPAAPKPVANGDVKKTPTPTRPASSSAGAAKKPASTVAAKADPAKAAAAPKTSPGSAVKTTRPAPTKPAAARPPATAASATSSSSSARPKAAPKAAAPAVKRNAALSPKSGAAK